ncbi:MAG: sulfatase [Deltaproteobacteria bacterium]|nr:sulfatase [Deltaproteobacteria bacterium]
MTNKVINLFALALLIPPALAWCLGGADFDALGQRLTWYGEEVRGCVPALLGTALLLLVSPRQNLRSKAGCLLASLLFLGTAAVAWTGGLDTEVLSIKDSLRPTIIAWVALAIGLFRSPSPVLDRDTRGALVQVCMAALLGLSLYMMVDHLDRRDVQERYLAREASESRGDVIFILVDTLRADALGSYGFTPSQTPFLDGLADQSVVFDLAVSQAPWTVPSVASLMTSLYPSTLDARGSSWKRVEEGRLLRLYPGAESLVTRFHDAGYFTSGFVKNAFLHPDSDYSIGFDLYEAVGGDSAEKKSARELVNAATRWGESLASVRAEGQGAPFFLYLHFMDPHIDYIPPRSHYPSELRDYDGPLDGSGHTLHELRKNRKQDLSEEDLQFLKALYAAEVAYLDSELQLLHERLSALGLWTEKTTLVFTADHGEQFAEHGKFEHGDVHIENVHVPLMFSAPGVSPRRVNTPVRLLDVAPTLLELMGLEPLPAEGRSLAASFSGDELSTLAAFTENQKGKYRVTSYPHSLVFQKKRARLYDLAQDRGETKDLTKMFPEIARSLEEEWSQHMNREIEGAIEGAGEPGNSAPYLDRKTRKQLEKLGYLQ